ncbi:MAG: DUF359 domain-containing protein, partial [bacterium]|nr:DUF359 domain-containing protein [bacterium]
RSVEPSLITSGLPTIFVKSGPGYISRDAMRIVASWGEKNIDDPSQGLAIIVDGEEDLLVLPVILASPIGAFILYGQPGYRTVPGQPGEGVVSVPVTSETKEKARILLGQFISTSP